MSTQDVNATRRDDRKRRTIEAMTMIAPTPELLLEVLSLQGGAGDRPPPRGYAVIDIAPDHRRVIG